MYGIILDGIRNFTCVYFGKNIWKQVMEHVGFDIEVFVHNKYYSESLFKRIITSITAITGMVEAELMHKCGADLHEFFNLNGFKDMLDVVGRDLSGFIMCLDDVHHSMKSKFPKMQNPTFIVNSQDKDGITITYMSGRLGFANYVIGILNSVANKIFHVFPIINIIVADVFNDHCKYKIELKFNNSKYIQDKCNREKQIESLKAVQIEMSQVESILPFCIFIDTNMKINSIGDCLKKAVPQIWGANFGQVFEIVRPEIQPIFDLIKEYTNVTFTIQLSIDDNSKSSDILNSSLYKNIDRLPEKENLTLEGTIRYCIDENCLMFTGIPICNSADELMLNNIFLADLGKCDISRDMYYLELQNEAEHTISLNKIKNEASRINEVLTDITHKLDTKKKLLEKIIPPAVALQLQNGIKMEPQIFKCATVLYTDIVGFTNICSNLTPMDVINLLTYVFTIFDDVCLKNNVYKIETIGDAYVLVGGIPIESKYHAFYAVNCAFDLIESLELFSKKNDKYKLKIRLGINSGPLVAGIVGNKRPRYSLFGDTSVMANSMESSALPMQVHITESTLREINVYDPVIDDGDLFTYDGEDIRTYYVKQKLKLKPETI